jgi:hypothetical protein
MGERGAGQKSQAIQAVRGNPRQAAGVLSVIYPIRIRPGGSEARLITIRKNRKTKPTTHKEADFRGLLPTHSNFLKQYKKIFTNKPCNNSLLRIRILISGVIVWPIKEWFTMIWSG